MQSTCDTSGEAALPVHEVAACESVGRRDVQLGLSEATGSEEALTPTKAEITEACQHLWSGDQTQHVQIVIRVLAEINNMRGSR